jgi:hypothetical protein
MPAIADSLRGSHIILSLRRPRVSVVSLESRFRFKRQRTDTHAMFYVDHSAQARRLVCPIFNLSNSDLSPGYETIYSPVKATSQSRQVNHSWVRWHRACASSEHVLLKNLPASHDSFSSDNLQQRGIIPKAKGETSPDEHKSRSVIS